MHIFAEARGVVEALHTRDCGPALAWCDANKPKLKKIRSSLEFQLRVQVRNAMLTFPAAWNAGGPGSGESAGCTAVKSAHGVTADPGAWCGKHG